MNSLKTNKKQSIIKNALNKNSNCRKKIKNKN